MGLLAKTTQSANLEATFLVPLSELAVIPPIDTPLAQAAEWFALDVANGDARPDTIRTYLSNINHWLSWCRVNKHDPGRPTAEGLKLFRQELVQNGAAHATISLKLTTIRRFYDGAVTRGLLGQNPATKIKAPRNRSADAETMVCLSAGEAELFFRAIPKDSRLINLRDRAMAALMMLEGLRRVEISRANIEDLEEIASGTRMFVRGKGRDGYIYPREDTTECISAYLGARESFRADPDGKPLFISLSKGGKELSRISRTGLSKWMDKMLERAGIKKAGRACHALRHTCGSLLYQPLAM